MGYHSCQHRIVYRTTGGRPYQCFSTVHEYSYLCLLFGVHALVLERVLLREEEFQSVEK